MNGFVSHFEEQEFENDLKVGDHIVEVDTMIDYTTTLHYLREQDPDGKAPDQAKNTSRPELASVTLASLE